MVPIHDTDLEQERWSKSAWENYELWEKVEGRLKRQRALWILATTIVVLVLSAVPIAVDRWPKWMTRSAARVLAQEVNRVKREATIDKTAYRIRFVSEGDLFYSVEKVLNCSAQSGELIRSGSLKTRARNEKFSWISSEKGREIGIPGLVNEFCYDYLAGSGSALRGDPVVGFGIIPVNDLAGNRMDRLSILLLTGTSAEASFD